VRKGDVVNRLEPKFYLLKYRNNEDRIYKSEFAKYNFKKITKLISDGTHFTPKYCDEGIKFLSVKDVRPFQIDYNNSKFISVEEADFLDKRCKPQKNDVLLTKIGTYGLASVINSDERFQIFVSVALLRPNDKVVLPEFLALCINSKLIYLQFERVIKGAGVPDLHLEDIRDIKIPVPPLEVQKQIIEKFEAAYNAKRAKEAEAKRLLDGIDAYLLERLGIETPATTETKRFFYRKLSEITGSRFDANSYHAERLAAIEAVKNGKYSSNKLKFLTDFPKTIVSETALPYIGLENIESNTGNFIETSEKQSFGSAIVFSKNQILFPKLRPYLNKVYYAEFDGVCSTEFHILDSKGEGLINEFLANVLRSKIIVSQTKHLMSGNTLPRLQTEDIENLLIPLPPVEVQEEIAAHIQSIRTRAKELEEDAKAEVERAKVEVEQMILGEVSAK